MAGVTVHVIGLGYVLLVVGTVEVVDHVRASIVCAVSVRSIRTVGVVGAVGLGMLWRSGLVVCGECWHVIGSGGYVLVGVFCCVMGSIVHGRSIMSGIVLSC